MERIIAMNTNPAGERNEDEGPFVAVKQRCTICGNQHVSVHPSNTDFLPFLLESKDVAITKKILLIKTNVFVPDKEIKGNV